MNDGTVIIKSKNLEPYRTNHFEIYIDDIDEFRLACNKVYFSTGYTDKIIAKFYLTDDIVSRLINNPAYELDTAHHVKIVLYSNDCSKQTILYDDKNVFIKEKRICLDAANSDLLMMTVIFG